jgi:hypothetical protein
MLGFEQVRCGPLGTFRGANGEKLLRLEGNVARTGVLRCWGLSLDEPHIGSVCPGQSNRVQCGALRNDRGSLVLDLRFRALRGSWMRHCEVLAALRMNRCRRRGP